MCDKFLLANWNPGDLKGDQKSVILWKLEIEVRLIID